MSGSEPTGALVSKSGDWGRGSRFSRDVRVELANT
jgi:hypothetical protein